MPKTLKAKPHKDIRTREAHRAASLIVRAIHRGDNQAAADLIRTIRTPDDLREALIVMASLAAAGLSKFDDPENFLSGFMWMGTGEWFDEGLSMRAKAKRLLERVLADGQRHSYVQLRAFALSEGIKTKDLRNAAQQLKDECGLESGDINSPQHWYRLPKDRARKAQEAR